MRKSRKIIAEDGSVSFEEDFQSSFEVPADSVIIAIVRARAQTSSAAQRKSHPERAFTG